jgi:hypothetical protein
MKVTFTDGKTREMPASNCTGYIASSIELTALDARYMRTLFERDPVTFGAWLRQFESRFAENRQATGLTRALRLHPTGAGL